MKDYNFDKVVNDLNELSPEQSQFYLTDKGSILQIGRDVGSERNTPFGNQFARESHKEFDYEAYNELFDNFYQKTQWALLDRVIDTIWEDHVATQVGNDDILIKFNNLKSISDEMEVELHVSKEVYDNLTPDKLLDMVREDFCYYNDNQALEFCIVNDIDVSDIVIFAKEEITLPDDVPGVVVVAIEDTTYDYNCGVSLSVLNDTGRQVELNEQLNLFKEWYNNNVYDVILFDKEGKQLDAHYDVIGQEDLKSSYVLSDNKVNIVKDLGVHENIKDCMKENKEVLRETQSQER